MNVTWRKFLRRVFKTTRSVPTAVLVSRHGIERLEDRLQPAIAVTPAGLITFVEGASNTVALATFTDDTPSAATDYTATIDWGDGGPTSTGSVSLSGNTFTVTDTHTYAEATPAGSPHAVAITITESTGDTDTGSAADNALVSDAPLRIEAGPVFFADEGATTGPVVLATFTDANPGDHASDFTTAINWGDGTAVDTSSGALSYDSATGVYTVTGSHTYVEEGNYFASIRITDADGFAVDTGVGLDGNGAVVTAATQTPGAWYPDRFPPNGFVGGQTDFGRTGVIDETISTADADGNRPAAFNSGFYDFQGRKYDLAAGTTYVTMDLYVPSSYAALDQQDQAGNPANFGSVASLWGEGVDATNTTASFPIIGFNNLGTNNGQSGSAGFQVFDQTNGWTNVPGFTGYDQWYQLSMAVVDGNLVYFVNGAEVYADTTPTGTVGITNETLQGYNGGAATAQTYDIFWNPVQDTAAIVADQQILNLFLASPGFTALEGESIGGPFAGVATFTDPAGQGMETAADFAATINWGDGNIDPATVVSDVNGNYHVDIPDHTYDEEGNYNLTVTVTHDSLPPVASNSVVLMVDDQQITNLFVASPGFIATEGTSIGGPFTGVATFTDPAGQGVETAADFAATIDWGDGTSDPATVVSDGNGNYHVNIPDHTYLDEGIFNLSVIITHDSLPPVTSNAVALIVTEADALAPAATQPTIPGVLEGASFGGPVAAFTDTGYPTNDPADFAATIDWGDGTTPDTGTVAGDGAGNFTVSGSHTYSNVGSFTVTVTLSDTDDDGSGLATASATARNTVTVTDQQLTSLTVTPPTVVEGQPTPANYNIATFTDPGGAEPISEQVELITNGGFETGDFSGWTVSDPSGETFVEGSEGESSITPHTGNFAAALGATTPLASLSQTLTTVPGQSYTLTYWLASDGQTPNEFRTIIGGIPVFDQLNIPFQDYTQYTFNFTATSTSTLIQFGEYNQNGFLSLDDVSVVTTVTHYSATIDWGDGATTDTGTVVHDSGNNFHVEAPSHTYGEEGSYPVTVAVTHNSLPPVTASANASVTEASLTITAAGSISTTEGQTFSGVVATASDPGSPDPGSNYTATIDWGDGSTIDTVTPTGSAGTYVISGSHSYADEGFFTISVTFFEASDPSFTVSATNSMNVAEGDTLTGTLAAINATEGTPFSGTVATFTDAGYPTNLPSDFTAAIDWGDGTSGPGTITGGNGTFLVSGNHTYADEGNFFVTVILNDDAPGTATGTASGTVTVAEGDSLTGTLASFGPTEGTTFSGTVATFTDTLSTSDASDFSATINWGDGTTTAGTVNGGSGTFTVSGSHLYTDEGDFTVSVILNDDAPGTATGTASGTVSVADADDFGAISPPAFSATEGRAFSGVVAVFSDSYTGNTAADLSATIDWGDGTTGTGTVSGGNGTFSVSGSHTYADEGTFFVQVTLSDDAPGTASLTLGADVSVLEGDSVVGFNQSISATEGTAFSGPVATFLDAGYPTNSPSDFTAIINWGDGATDTGTVSGGNGAFIVSGSHTYTEEGTFHATVTLTDVDDGSGQATATGTAAVTVNVAEGDVLTGTLAAIAPTEGTAFSGTVATFTDTLISNDASDFTATIDWGDGTTTAGTVSGSNGTFTVNGNHTYADEGDFTVSVVLRDDSPGTATGAATGTVSVAEGDVLAGSAPNQTVIQGVPFTRTLATFTNTGYPANPASDFKATIDWGDGTPPSSGTVSGGNGTYSVSGTHTYANAGPFTLSVTLADDAPGTATAVATATAHGSVLVVPPAIVVGPVSGGSEIRVVNVDTGAAVRTFVPYGPDFAGGISVALGDVTGDGIPDVVTAAGFGGSGHIKVYDGLTGTDVYSFFAYDPTFRDGAFVAVGDVNGDGFADIITGAGFGGAPHVKVFSGKDLSLLASFFAYDSSFRNGVHVGAGDVTGDGKADVITGVGPGSGPNVKVFDVIHGRAEVYSFFAYAESFSGGVFVSGGDVNGDGKADIITGAASGGSGHIKVFSGADGSQLNSFFAFSPNGRDGVTVAGVDPNQTGRTSIAAGLSSGSPGLVKLFDPMTLSETDVFSTLDSGFQHGVYVG